jgi:hypothetical protein
MSVPHQHLYFFDFIFGDSIVNLFLRISFQVIPVIHIDITRPKEVGQKNKNVAHGRNSFQHNKVSIVAHKKDGSEKHGDTGNEPYYSTAFGTRFELRVLNPEAGQIPNYTNI